VTPPLGDLGSVSAGGTRGRPPRHPRVGGRAGGREARGPSRAARPAEGLGGAYAGGGSDHQVELKLKSVLYMFKN